MTCAASSRSLLRHNFAKTNSCRKGSLAIWGQAKVRLPTCADAQLHVLWEGSEPDVAHTILECTSDLARPTG